uniref:Uncharacterized protein n=1 Tax=Timema genevievae TaxID=629358 RepID=A0A7R9JTX6_TIMGE|nr:unnamed protein product [Timema genevievae]
MVEAFKVSVIPSKVNEGVFKLRLTPDTNIFADDVVFEGTKGAVDFDPRKAYIGTLEGKFSQPADLLSNSPGLGKEDVLFSLIRNTTILPYSERIGTMAVRIPPEISDGVPRGRIKFREDGGRV